VTPTAKFELQRWVYLVVLFLITGIVCILLVGLLFLVPLLKWLIYDIPYALPTWSHASRIALAVLIIALIGGTAGWYYEKRTAGR
jgi:hypothetical protein